MHLTLGDVFSQPDVFDVKRSGGNQGEPHPSANRKPVTRYSVCKCELRSEKRER